MINILLCDSDKNLAANFSKELDSEKNLIATVDTGKQVQAMIMSEQIDVLIINLEVKNYSIFEVLMFLKQNSRKTQIIVVADSKKIIDDYFYSEKEISRLGISEILIKPFPINKIINLIDSFYKHTSWKTITPIDLTQKNNLTEETIHDSKFTSINIDEFCPTNLAIFDLYIRLSKNKFIKILKQGEMLEKGWLHKYKNERNVERLYFKTSDRLSYINFMNDLILRNITSKTSNEQSLNILEGASKQYIDEVYTTGLPEPVYEEGLRTCDGIYKTLNDHKGMGKLLKKYIFSDSTETGHVFLTAFLTTLVTTNIEWVTEHSRNTIIMGSFLHDIGKLKLPKEIQEKKEYELTEEEHKIYQKHPEYGVEMLENISIINEQIKQIVYQHHEVNTGEGFPNQLLSKRIYPPAKIVGFCNFISNQCIKHKVSPFEVIKLSISEKSDILKYDPEIIKAFIKCFS